jgi:hypothetical protein
MSEELQRVQQLAAKHGYEVQEKDENPDKYQLSIGGTLIKKIETLADIETFLDSDRAKEVVRLNKRLSAFHDEIDALIAGTNIADWAAQLPGLAIGYLLAEPKDLMETVTSWGAPGDRERLLPLVDQYEDACDDFLEAAGYNIERIPEKDSAAIREHTRWLCGL